MSNWTSCVFLFVIRCSRKDLMLLSRIDTALLLGSFSEDQKLRIWFHRLSFSCQRSVKKLSPVEKCYCVCFWVESWFTRDCKSSGLFLCGLMKATWLVWWNSSSGLLWWGIQMADVWKSCKAVKIVPLIHTSNSWESDTVFGTPLIVRLACFPVLVTKWLSVGPYESVWSASRVGWWLSH